jgi:hypothetical protein
VKNLDEKEVIESAKRCAKRYEHAKLGDSTCPHPKLLPMVLLKAKQECFEAARNLESLTWECLETVRKLQNQDNERLLKAERDSLKNAAIRYFDRAKRYRAVLEGQVLPVLGIEVIRYKWPKIRVQNVLTAKIPNKSMNNQYRI